MGTYTHMAYTDIQKKNEKKNKIEKLKLKIDITQR